MSDATYWQQQAQYAREMNFRLQDELTRLRAECERLMEDAERAVLAAAIREAFGIKSPT